MIIANSPGVQIISASGKNRHTVIPLIICVMMIESEYCIECFIWFLMLESPEEKNEFTDKLKVNQTWQFESPVISTPVLFLALFPSLSANLRLGEL